MADADPELERLRRASFARDATDADVHAYVTALAARSAVVTAAAPTAPVATGPDAAEPDAAEPDAADPGAKAPDPEPVAGPAEGRARMPRRALVGAVGAAGVLLGIAAGVVVGLQLQPQAQVARPSGVAVLERWQELPMADVPTGLDLENPDARGLGELDGVRFTGTVGTGGPSLLAGDEVVCFNVTMPDGSGVGSCATRSDFIDHGIWVGTGGPQGEAAYLWSPDGPPGPVTCSPGSWTYSCPGSGG
jgi:hypothetical protein